MQLRALRVADPPGRWEGLGFAIEDGRLALGGVALELGGEGAGITAWSLPEVDGLRTFKPAPEPSTAIHPNGAIGLDHVVVVTPDFARTRAALEAAQMPLRRVQGTMGFRRLGPVILELVEAKAEPRNGPARFWGLVVVVRDLDALKARLDDQLSEPKPAVQPGRRIVTLRASAGLSPAVAFMTPES
jgi:hypothetical protein